MHTNKCRHFDCVGVEKRSNTPLTHDQAGRAHVSSENNPENPQTVQGIKPFYSKIIRKSFDTTETKYSFLNGILTFKKDSRGAQRLRFCGIMLYSKTDKGFFRTSRLLGIPLHKKDLRPDVFEKIVANTDPKYDGIYISRHNIGETYVYLTHLDNWIRKNGSKKPVVIVWRKKDIEFYKMFMNENIALQYIDIPQQDLHTVFTNKPVEYKGRKIFCHTPDIVPNIMNQREQNPNWNFYSHICQDFDLDTPDKLTKPVVSQKTKDAVKAKIKTYFNRPFVILIPNANSLQTIPVDFWNNIIKKLDNLGYDVFVNNHRAKHEDRDGLDATKTITFDCNLAEMYELAKHSDGIITLASGLAVLLTATGKKMDLIYTKINPIDGRDVSAGLMQSMYSVYYLPGVDDKKVKEYNADLYNQDELLDTIIKRYK